VQRVLEFVAGSENFLSPKRLLGAAKNPAFHILGFHHEHAKLGNQNVINLRGAILGGKGYVFDQVVAGLVEQTAGREISRNSPNLPLNQGVLTMPAMMKKGIKYQSTATNGWNMELKSI
jgi:hypothetical protein